MPQKTAGFCGRSRFVVLKITALSGDVRPNFPTIALSVTWDPRNPAGLQDRCQFVVLKLLDVCVRDSQKTLTSIDLTWWPDSNLVSDHVHPRRRNIFGPYQYLYLL